MPLPRRYTRTQIVSVDLDVTVFAIQYRKIFLFCEFCSKKFVDLQFAICLLRIIWKVQSMKCCLSREMNQTHKNSKSQLPFTYKLKTSENIFVTFGDCFYSQQMCLQFFSFHISAGMIDMKFCFRLKIDLKTKVISAQSVWPLSQTNDIFFISFNHSLL